MASFIFGLHPNLVKSPLKRRIEKALRRKNLKKVVNELVSEPGEHILPLLKGDERDLELVRRRYFELIFKVFPKKELAASLRSELETGMAESLKGASDLIFKGSSIECRDWLPDWFCDWWGGVSDGDGGGGNGEGDDDDEPKPEEGPDDIEMPPLCLCIGSDGCWEPYWHEPGPDVA